MDWTMDQRFRSCIVLGIRPDAGAEEIKRAYRDLARQWHPDRVGPDERRRREAAERFRQIAEAYRTLQGEESTPRTGGRAVPSEPGYDAVGWKEAVASHGRQQAEVEASR